MKKTKSFFTLIGILFLVSVFARMHLLNKQKNIEKKFG
jgi:hypothetical protein